MELGLGRSNVGTWIGVGVGAPWGTVCCALLVRAAGCELRVGGSQSAGSASPHKHRWRSALSTAPE